MLGIFCSTFLFLPYSLLLFQNHHFIILVPPTNPLFCFGRFGAQQLWGQQRGRPRVGAHAPGQIFPALQRAFHATEAPGDAHTHRGSNGGTQGCTQGCAHTRTETRGDAHGRMHAGMHTGMRSHTEARGDTHTDGCTQRCTQGCTHTHTHTHTHGPGLGDRPGRGYAHGRRQQRRHITTEARTGSCTCTSIHPPSRPHQNIPTNRHRITHTAMLNGTQGVSISRSAAQSVFTETMSHTPATHEAIERTGGRVR